MILVVMVGMSIAFSYIVVYANNYKSGAGSSVLESLTIEDIWIKNSNTVQLTVYNAATAANLGTGTGLDTTIVAIYVNGLAIATQPNGNSFALNTLVGAGSHQTITGYWLGTFQSGTPYDFKIVTSRGSNFELQYTAP